MFVTWCWALLGLWITKLLEAIFKTLLKMPNSWLSSDLSPPGIRILSASDGKQDITNRFKLFLKFYWENDVEGFSFASLQRLLNCSALYCSYLLTNKDGSISPETFWKNVNRFLVSMDGDTCVQYLNAELTKKREQPFGLVKFNQLNQNVRQTNDRIRNDLLSFMAESKICVPQLVDKFENS